MIDLNADVGERNGAEGIAADLVMLDAVSSANVACGFHAGDAGSMRAICDAALARDVRIGAHVSYADRKGFGRRDQDVAPARLVEQTVEQLGTLAAIAVASGARVRYVKPHGALYNRAAVDLEIAAAIVDAIVGFDPALLILAPPSSALATVATAAGLEAVAEGFADRAYLPDGTLMPRSSPSGVLDHASALAQALSIARDRVVRTPDGGSIPVPARSLCVHSDTPGAGELARAIRAGLLGAGVELRPFT